jgi:hypothetical protein
LGIDGYGRNGIVPLKKLLYIFVLLLFVNTSHSQVIDGVEIVKPRIITGEWNPETKKFPVAVEFVIAKGWHMYWLNPGDAGSPPEVKWSLPMDWYVEKLQFPVPEHIIEDGFESFAYFDTLTLYTQITSPRAPLPNDTIDAGIHWTVCKDICVAGSLVCKWPIEMTSVSHDWPWYPIVSPLGQYCGITRTPRETANGYEITIELQAGCRLPPLIDFYPLPPDNLPIKSNLQKKKEIITISADGVNAKARVGMMNGLMIFKGGDAFWLNDPNTHD